MTIREKLECTICEQKYLLRISLGHSEMQSHTFECKECGTDITVDVIIDFEKFNSHTKYKENCIKTNFNDDLLGPKNQEYTVVNLHPELLVPKEFVHDPLYSASINEGSRLMEERSRKIGPENFLEGYESSKKFTDNLNHIEKNWLILKVSWKMINNKKKEHLIIKQLKKYKSNTIDSKNASFEEILFDFNNTLLFPDLIEKSPEFFQYFKNSIDINSNEEYKKSITYSKRNLFNENMKKYFDMYSNFFDIYNEFKQVLLYVSTSQKIPMDFIVSSHDFEKTKLFYGQLYETYTSNVSFISILHNIYKGRKFDQFLNMTLEQYLKKDKAGRCDNFRDTTEFDWFSEFITSKLRNASHHGNIQLEENIVTYKAGKSLNKYTMTYTRYLEICMELFYRLVCLTQLQILIVHIDDNQN